MREQPALKVALWLFAQGGSTRSVEAGPLRGPSQPAFHRIAKWSSHPTSFPNTRSTSYSVGQAAPVRSAASPTTSRAKAAAGCELTGGAVHRSRCCGSTCPTRRPGGFDAVVLVEFDAADRVAAAWKLTGTELADAATSSTTRSGKQIF